MTKLTAAKAKLAALGMFLTVVQSALTPDTLWWNIVSIALAVLTTAGVYKVPNRVVSVR